jgi:hypothetical protein
MRPIRIYLDSSDYANFSKATLEPRYKAVYDFLIQKLDEGAIEIGYSAWNVFELIQKADEQFRADRVRRADALRSLCRGKAFPHPMDFETGHRFPNDGLWVPRSVANVVSARGFREKMREAVKENEKLTRAQKRRLSSTDGLKLLVSEFDFASAEREILSRFPVTDKFKHEKYFSRLLSGNISDSAFNKEASRWLFDPAHLFMTYYQYSDIDPLDFIKKSNDKLDDFFQQFFSARSAAEDAYEKYQGAQKDIKKFYDDIGVRIPERFREKVKKPARTLDIGLDTTRKVNGTSIGIFNCYMNAIMSGRANRSPSDLADAVHITHVSSCDLLRCDKKMFAIFKDCPFIPAQKLVPRIEEIPDRINELLLVIGT